MRTSPAQRGRQSAEYAFDSLHSLPCGCVAAVYRTQPWDVELVALEARGPHCIHQQHELGSVLGLGFSGSDRLSR
jgi:hypothetical protein